MSAGCLAARKNKQKKTAGNVRRGGSWRCVKSVTVSVASVSAQLVMEDMNVCRACDSLEYVSHLRIVDLCDFLGVIVMSSGVPTQKSVHPESCSDRDPHAQVCHRQHPRTCAWEHQAQVSPPQWSDAQQNSDADCHQP